MTGKIQSVYYDKTMWAMDIDELHTLVEDNFEIDEFGSSISQLVYPFSAQFEHGSIGKALYVYWRGDVLLSFKFPIHFEKFVVAVFQTKDDLLRNPKYLKRKET